MKKKKNFREISIVLWILIFMLVVLILINMNVWKYLEKKEIEMISIPDKCSVLFGNILHNIKDEASCENACRSECFVRKKEFYSSEFYFKEESCNECNCYCK